VEVTNLAFYVAQVAAVSERRLLGAELVPEVQNGVRPNSYTINHEF
jgi:hypothetical protein